MKKFAIFSTLLLFSMCLMAQKAELISVSAKATSKVMPLQLGTGNTTNGVFEYKFETPVDLEYSVTLTPLTDNTALYVTAKTAQGFSVKTVNGAEASFDFVVFAKKMAPTEVKPE